MLECTIVGTSPILMLCFKPAVVKHLSTLIAYIICVFFVFVEMIIADPASEQLEDYLKTHRASSILRTTWGAPVPDFQSSLTVNPYGTLLLQDNIFLDTMAHFSREIQKERAVHPRGSGGEGGLRFSPVLEFLPSRLGQSGLCSFGGGGASLTRACWDCFALLVPLAVTCAKVGWVGASSGALTLGAGGGGPGFCAGAGGQVRIGVREADTDAEGRGWGGAFWGGLGSSGAIFLGEKNVVITPPRPEVTI
ncbi:hypothetical protein C0J52_01924 [Blattella germanica]|nr:hypothetical protein C0J52_01924 [Blattella germanica]